MSSQLKLVASTFEEVAKPSIHGVEMSRKLIQLARWRKKRGGEEGKGRRRKRRGGRRRRRRRRPLIKFPIARYQVVVASLQG